MQNDWKFPSTEDQQFAIPRFSFEARLSRYLDEWQMSIDNCALLATLFGVRLSKTRLAGALSGKERALSNEIAVQLEILIKEVNALRQMLAPIVPDLNNATWVYEWLRGIRSGSLQISVTQQ
jgi:hypothetical protein